MNSFIVIFPYNLRTIGQFFIAVSLVLLIASIRSTSCQNASPCPELFSYEPKGTEADRWYGVIALGSSVDLDGVWIKIILDHPAELLGNWFGEVSGDDQEFTITNSRYKLEAGPPISVRFFVKYDTRRSNYRIPSVKNIRLNGKTICSEQIVETTTPQLHLSRPISSTNNRQNYNSEDQTNYQSSGSFNNKNRFNDRDHDNNQVQNNRGSDNSNNNRRPTSSQSNYDDRNTQQNSSPSNNNRDNSRPSGQGLSFNNNNNNQNGLNSNNRQPTRNTSNASEQNTNNRDDSGTQYQNKYNGLSVDNKNFDNNNSNNNRDGSGSQLPVINTNFDFFPGDLIAGQTSKPNSNRNEPQVIHTQNTACGIVAMRAAPLLSHGQNTTQGQWPWHVAIYHSQGAALMYTCGGTLISEQHVLTAAHCVTKPQTNRPIDTNRLAVYLGKHSLKRFGTGTQDREIAEVILHPRYNYSIYFNDIAVLKLERPVDITNYVRPCCLWEDSNEIDPLLNKLGTVVGWGFDEKRQISDTLMQAEMPVVSTVTCIYSNREFFSQFTNEKTYCAGFRNGTTVCNGDSGGGMVFPKAGTSGQSTVWQIRGIVSVGVALQGQGVCDPSHYVVFTDVAKHLDWIKRIMYEERNVPRSAHKRHTH